MDYDTFCDLGDQAVKEMKETEVDTPCLCCFGRVSQWDIETRHGVCGECFWGRCLRGSDCRIDEFHPRRVFEVCCGPNEMCSVCE